MSVRFYYIALVGFLFFYFSFGMLSEYVFKPYLERKDEIYPVFTWNLFSRIPNERDEYHMEILQVGDRVYEPPLQLRDAKEYFDSIKVAPTEYDRFVRFLGEAVRDGEEAQTAKSFLGEMFAGEETYHYKIYLVRYDPVQYWRTYEYTSKKEIIDVYEEGN